MFLDKTFDKSFNLDGLMNESYEYLIEYQQEMHELDMKMIKCEHHAIVNEDSGMMMLAEEEYKSKAEAAIKAIWNKIVITIQNFIITINKAISKFKTLFLTKEFKSKLDAVINDPDTIVNWNNTDYEGHYTGKSGEFINTVKNDKKKLVVNMTSFEYDMVCMNPVGITGDIEYVVEQIISGKRNTDALKRFFDKKFGDDTKNKAILEKQITRNDLVNIYSVLTKYGPQWVSSLERARKSAKTNVTKVFTDSENTADATYFQRAINKVILRIQKIINACFKVCYSIKNSNRK